MSNPHAALAAYERKVKDGSAEANTVEHHRLVTHAKADNLRGWAFGMLIFGTLISFAMSGITVATRIVDNGIYGSHTVTSIGWDWLSALLGGGLAFLVLMLPVKAADAWLAYLGYQRATHEEG
jgi:hypothetical protein